MKSKVSFFFILLILAIFAVSASAGAESEGGTLTIGLSVEPFTIDPTGGIYMVLPVSLMRLFLSSSIPSPVLPITIPGLAVAIIIFTLSAAGLSITTLATPAA